MGNRADLWSLLIQRKGQWINRADIDFVGGHEAGRRMREIRTSLIGNPKYRLDERDNVHGLRIYRLIEISTDAQRAAAHEVWRCKKCSARLMDLTLSQRTMDDRWRFARCTGCGDKKAIFERQHT